MARKISKACVKGGDAQCSHYACECPCHGSTGENIFAGVAGPVGIDGFVDANPLPQTVKGVKEWHDGMYAALAAYDPAAARDLTPFGGYHVEVVA